jgi:16S rRNA (uracil1498-N3)-methyltransferase
MSKNFNLPRIFISAALTQNNIFTLDETQTHYLKNVLRKKTGDQIRVFNGKDGEWLATLETISKRNIALKAEKLLRPQPPAKTGLTLCFAPLKNNNLHYVLQKSTELGISAFQPLQTQRTIINKLNEERMMANIIEAAEQCERLDLPTLYPLKTLTQFLQQLPADSLLLFADETGNGEPLKNCPHNIFSDSPAQLLIGPEGGFSDAERQQILLRQKHFAFGLGPRILRAETAAIAAIAYLQIQLGDCNQPPRFMTIPDF